MAVPQSLLTALARMAEQEYDPPLDPAAYQGTEYETLVALVAKIAQHAAASRQQSQTFVANVAHELRTPVTILRGVADGLLDGTVPKGQLHQTLSILSQETQRLEAVIQSMLQLTRLEQGQIPPLSCAWFTLGDVVFHTLLLFQSRIEKRGIQIQGLESLSQRIYADRELMGQVVFNLVDNAVKFVNTGGTISFSLETAPTSWRFTIGNTGARLTQSEADQLFQRFYQANSGYSHNETGLGIGLDLVWHILQWHQGTISVQCGPETQVAFILTLPRQTPPTS